MKFDFSNKKNILDQVGDDRTTKRRQSLVNPKPFGNELLDKIPEDKTFHMTEFKEGEKEPLV